MKMHILYTYEYAKHFAELIVIVRHTDTGTSEYIRKDVARTKTEFDTKRNDWEQLVSLFNKL